MTMGDRIKSLRKEHRMTQTELGDILGVGKSAILKYENGSVENIPRSTIQKMASIFGVSPSYLMCFDKWEEERLSDEVALIERIQTKWGKDTVKLLDMFLSMNTEGQSKLLNTAEDMNALDKYQK